MSRRTQRIVLIVAVFAVSLVVALASVRWRPNPAPVQPIPFSHRLHVQDKKLDCVFCHNTAARSSNAGMPPLEKCLLCHDVIAPRFWPIAKLHDYKKEGQPVPWVRVVRLPRHVRFSHEPHIAKRIDCGECHGNVAAMDRVRAVHVYDMNFCITCHWKEKASDSCYTCHY